MHTIKNLFTCWKNLDSLLKSRDIALPTKVHGVKAMVFPVVMYGCENWTIKKSECWRMCSWTVVLEKTLESPLDWKVNPKGNQNWIFIGRTDAEAEAAILRPPDEKSWLIRKDSGAGKDWGQEEKGTTEYEMIGWHHQLSGHEFKQAPGDGEGLGSLVFWSSWVCKESDTIRWLNSNKFTCWWTLSLPSPFGCCE